jgi:hypothetical protein
MGKELSIYDCQELIRLVDEKANEESGEVSEPDMQLIVDAHTQSIELLNKMVGYMGYLGRFCDNAISEIDRIEERYRAAKNRLDNIKRYLLPYVKNKGGKVTVGTHQLSIRKSKAVVIADGFDNPMYSRIVPETKEPDKKKIKESIESGIEVKGAILENRESLQVK